MFSLNRLVDLQVRSMLHHHLNLGGRECMQKCKFLGHMLGLQNQDPWQWGLEICIPTKYPRVDFFPLNFYFLIFWLWHMACGIVPHPGPQLWKLRVLTTRPQGISPPQGFLMDIYIKNSFPYLGAVNMFTFKNSWRDCPGSPVVKYSPFNAGDSGSIPCCEIKIPCALW